MHLNILSEVFNVLCIELSLSCYNILYLPSNCLWPIYWMLIQCSSILTFTLYRCEQPSAYNKVCWTNQSWQRGPIIPSSSSRGSTASVQFIHCIQRNNTYFSLPAFTQTIHLQHKTESCYYFLRHGMSQCRWCQNWINGLVKGEMWQ